MTGEYDVEAIRTAVMTQADTAGPAGWMAPRVPPGVGTTGGEPLRLSVGGRHGGPRQDGG